MNCYLVMCDLHADNPSIKCAFSEAPDAIAFVDSRVPRSPQDELEVWHMPIDGHSLPDIVYAGPKVAAVASE